MILTASVYNDVIICRTRDQQQDDIDRAAIQGDCVRITWFPINMRKYVSSCGIDSLSRLEGDEGAW